MSSLTSVLPSTGNGSGSASDRTSTSSATTSIAPVGSSGFSFPAGRGRTSPVTRTQNSARRLVRGLLLAAPDDLDDAARVAQVDEDHAAVVAPPRHPACQYYRSPACSARSVPASWVRIIPLLRFPLA